MTPKPSKACMWVQCGICKAYIPTREKENHKDSCSQNETKIIRPFIKNNVFYGILDIKTKDDISGLSLNNINDLIFLSQSAMQLCNIKIGDQVIVKLNGKCPVVRAAWPTGEKSSSSILMTENAIQLTWTDVTKKEIAIESLQEHSTAVTLTLSPLNLGKNIEINSDIVQRILRTYINKIVCRNNMLSITYYGKKLNFEVINITNDANAEDLLSKKLENISLEASKAEFYRINEKTSVIIKNIPKLKNEKKLYTLPRLGGIDSVRRKLQNFRNIVFENPNNELTIKSVLLYGFPGTGKSCLADWIAKDTYNQLGVPFLLINGSSIYSKYSGDAEETLKKIILDATSQETSLIIFDDIDILCPNRNIKASELEKRIISTLIQLLDNLRKDTSKKVFILATSNKPDSIDSSLRRFGRFDVEIEVSIPDENGRGDILSAILLNNFCQNLNDNDLAMVSKLTPGYVGSDLMLVCATALNLSETITFNNIIEALKQVKPSAMREAQIESPNVKWSDIGGQESLKLKLKQAIEWPLTHPQSFQRMGLKPPRGVLMYGPPGCSKTMIAKALATETKFNFLSIKGPELFNKYVGESEKAIRDLFKRARQASPSIIFFDEIDAIGGERSISGSGNSVQERVLAQLLTELDGVTALGNVTVVAATNRPDRIDKALLRPGRLDRIVYVPLPDEVTRREIFEIRLRNMPVVNIQINNLVESTENYSGAEIHAVCNEAAMKALEEDFENSEITMSHFIYALDIVKPRTPESLLKIYNEFNGV